MGRDDMSNAMDEPSNELETVPIMIDPSVIELEFSLTPDQVREWYSIIGITPTERERWKLRLADYLERKARKQELQYTRHRQREFGLKMRHEHRLKMLRDQSSGETSST